MDRSKTLEMLKKFLPPHDLIHEEVETIDLGKVHASVAGIAVSFSKDDIVFGSSLSFEADAFELAAFELLERFVITRDKPKIDMLEAKYIYSLSNGVAIHRSTALAQEAAELELLERNEVLRSWYLNAPSRRLNSTSFASDFKFLEADYEISFYDFSNHPGVSVVGVFAFPFKRDKPFLSGYGAGRNIQSAFEKSKKEFFARFTFLRGVNLEEDVSFAPSAEFHQDYYLAPEKNKIIQNWLQESSESKVNPDVYLGRNLTFQSLTPESWSKDFSISKALSEDVIPLFFGYLPQHTFNFTHRCDIPHPIY